jgi:hypothetical protein
MTPEDARQLYAKVLEIFFPLDDPTSNIRILTLRHGRRNAPLKITLRCMQLGGPDKGTKIPRVDYEVVSYAWESEHHDSTPRTARSLKELYTIPLHAELESALKRLRRRWTDRTLWIDALCVNQYDPIERRGQAAIMGEIYARARCVNVWLGEAVDSPSLHLAPFGRGLFAGRLRHRRMQHMALDFARLTWALEHRPEALVWEERAWLVQHYCAPGKVYFCAGATRCVLGGADRRFRDEVLLRGGASTKLLILERFVWDRRNCAQIGMCATSWTLLPSSAFVDTYPAVPPRPRVEECRYAKATDQTKEI